MQYQPTISVLLPVYNAERYLLKAVESILTQTFDDFELLALDDGSTDTSVSILRECAANDSRLRIWSRANRGLVATLNELIGSARGPFLARMDGDDVSRPQRFAKQISYLNEHPECVAVGSRVLFIDPEGRPICEAIRELTHKEIDEGLMCARISMHICHPSVMMRTAAVKALDGYRNYASGEDLDLFLRLGEIGKLANLPEVLLEYRQHFGSMSFSVKDATNFAKAAVAAAWRRRGATIDNAAFDCASAVETSTEIYRKWAWWALSAGNLATSRRYAFKAFLEQPLSIGNLRVLACSIRGY